MTIKEKRKRLNEYCEERDCEGCILEDRNKEYGYCYSEPLEDYIVEENYNMVFGDEKPEFLEKELNIPSMDPVNRPAHYTDGKIEVIDYIEDKKLGFCLGNVIKYVSRAGKKDPEKEIEDLNKAKWYLERRIKELEEVTS